MTIEPRTLMNSPLAVFVLSTAVLLSGSWLSDRLKTTTQSTAETIKLEALDLRVTTIQNELSDYQHNALTSSQFNEFRTAQDRRLDDLRDDMKNLVAQMAASQRLRAR